MNRYIGIRHRGQKGVVGHYANYANYANYAIRQGLFAENIQSREDAQ